jgi:environmental stress-induced protein Ves
MPWKNGGGSTTEIAIYPEASSVSGVPFLWRVSIAEVTVNGPFSSFPGYDRHIMVIEGEGMRLDAGPRGVIHLGKPFIPVGFSGDWEVTGILNGGPVRDFNLMTSHAETRSMLTCVVLLTPRRYAVPQGFCLLYLLEGSGTVDGQAVTAGDTIYLVRHDEIELKPQGTLRVAVCQIMPQNALALP